MSSIYLFLYIRKSVLVHSRGSKQREHWAQKLLDKKSGNLDTLAYFARLYLHFLPI